MAYEIEVRPAALRALKKIDKRDQSRIQGAIALLAADPRPPGAKALRGRDGLRIRVGDYRISTPSRTAGCWWSSSPSVNVERCTTNERYCVLWSALGRRSPGSRAMSAVPTVQAR